MTQMRLKKDLEDEPDLPLEKRMSMMRLRRMPSMLRLKKMTQMRLKKNFGVAQDEEEPVPMRPYQQEDCVWFRGVCISLNEVIKD